LLTGLPAALSVTVLSLFPIVNPIGNLPAFFALTAADSPTHRRAQAVRTAVWVVAVLVTFAVAGRYLLNALGISLPALQIAGGLVVARTDYGMVIAGPRLTPDEEQAGTAAADVSFVPMAMPLLAGPGAIGTVIALSSRSRGPAPITGVVAGVTVIGLVVALVLALGGPLLTRLGHSGITALSRIFGFLILAIAVELISYGILAVAPGLTRT
jgi:multiple antibiotic resistance protein